MHELHLFAGIGGGILGGMLLGHTTVCAVEIDKYCRKILLQRQRDGILPAFPIWDDVKSFRGDEWKGRIDVICGGFPCQDISSAGTGVGITGERSGLWSEMSRIIGEVQPKYCYVENVPMLLVRGIGRVLGDLAALGYDSKWGIVSAADTGAPHRRERIWIVANYDINRCDDESQEQESLEGQTLGVSVTLGQQWEDSFGKGNVPNSDRNGEHDGSLHAEVAGASQSLADAGIFNAGSRRPERSETRIETANGSQDVAHADCGIAGRQDAGWQEREGFGEHQGRAASECGWWESEPDVGRVANGVSSRVDKLRGLGNAQVPAVARLAWRMLANPDK